MVQKNLAKESPGKLAKFTSEATAKRVCVDLGIPVDGLTERETVFVADYLTNGLNARRATIRAGYGHENGKPRSSMSVQRHTFILMNRKGVRLAIQEGLRLIAGEKQDWLARLAQIARGDLGDVYAVTDRGDGAFTIMEKTACAGISNIIKSVKDTKFGTEITLHDPLAAIDRLLKAQEVQANQQLLQYAIEVDKMTPHERKRVVALAARHCAGDVEDVEDWIDAELEPEVDDLDD